LRVQNEEELTLVKDIGEGKTFSEKRMYGVPESDHYG
jgi:hypothetical protein